MPPIKCIACRVTYEGARYHIHSNGLVFKTTVIDGNVVDSMFFEPESIAKLIRREALRQRRNRNARERTQAMKDLGLKRGNGGAFGGWE